jgi:hypothetical protein
MNSNKIIQLLLAYSLMIGTIIYGSYGLLTKNYKTRTGARTLWILAAGTGLIMIIITIFLILGLIPESAFQ